MVLIIANYGQVIGDLQNKWRRIEDQYNVLENWLEKGLYFSRENAHYYTDRYRIWLGFWQYAWNVAVRFFSSFSWWTNVIKLFWPIIWLCILAGTIDSWFTNRICPLAEKYSSILLTNLWLKLPKSDHFRPRNFGLLIEFPARGTVVWNLLKYCFSADLSSSVNVHNACWKC